MAQGAGPRRVGPGGRTLATHRAAFAWDAHGRLAQRLDSDPARSWTYAYDDDSRLIEARRGDGFSVRYLYDPFGRRVAAIRSDGVSTYFGWDRDAAVEEVYSTGGSSRYVFRDDGYTPLLARGVEGGWQLVATDAVSTPWLYLGADGAISAIDLDPLGNDARVEGRPPPLRFAGQRADVETGLRYHRHRYYAPELGTFLTPDPMGLAGSLHDVGFVPNATEYLDPLGLVIIIGTYDQETIDAAYARSAATNNQEVLRADELYGPHNPNGVPIVGETHVEVVSHGSREGGKVRFDNGGTNRAGQPNRWTNGQDLGTALQHAGLEPNAEVVVVACNAAQTPTGSPRQSVIAGVTQATGNPTSGPSGIAYVRPYGKQFCNCPATRGGVGSVDLTDGHWEQATGPRGSPPTQAPTTRPSTQHADTWHDPEAPTGHGSDHQH
ncbi:RHS repeat-associated core domain-containing protein [Sorangium sp. So ce1078]|uniref:RHS repeat-associated core domain-containing protein n=1 Tax=Sorangium sp. So ce1078 TaxID=3133329 RepID=UPI003F63963A